METVLRLIVLGQWPQRARRPSSWSLETKCWKQAPLKSPSFIEDSVEGISIPGTLISGGAVFRAADKVDSGAEVCLFRCEAGA
jgi:hypothetical protein